MSAQQYSHASQTLDDINSVLDAIESDSPDPFSVSTLASDYLSISTTLQQQGYEVQSINTNENAASVYVTGSTGSNKIELLLNQSGAVWYLAP
jgi:hypothetical protein